MSAHVNLDVKASFDAANSAQELMSSWMMTFQAACLRKDWEAVDEARFMVLEQQDRFMENYAAGYKRMETQ